MSIEDLSTKLLSKITNLNESFQNFIVEPKSLKILSNNQINNLKELESKFDGNVKIVVSDSEFIRKKGPCTVPGYSTIEKWNDITSDIKAILSRVNLIKGTDIKVEKVGETFNVDSSSTVVIYVPRWFLADELISAKSHLTIDSDTRIGIILHELGHWDSANSSFILFGALCSLFGIFLILSKAFTKQGNVLQEDKATDIVMKHTVHPLILTILGIILYWYGSKVFGSFAETGADRYAIKYGYGDELDKFLQVASAKSVDTTKELKSTLNLLSEVLERAKTGYPSIDWRSRDLLKVSENEDYITELNFWSFSNILENMLIKLNDIVSKWIPLHNIRSLNIISAYINENIDLLINELTEK